MEDIIEMGIKYKSEDVGYWIHLVEERDQWRNVINMTKKSAVQ